MQKLIDARKYSKNIARKRRDVPALRNVAGSTVAIDHPAAAAIRARLFLNNEFSTILERSRSGSCADASAAEDCAVPEEADPGTPKRATDGCSDGCHMPGVQVLPGEPRCMEKATA
jgi:hypothetical protein